MVKHIIAIVYYYDIKKKASQVVIEPLIKMVNDIGNRK
jgi:hypothetical protein